MIGEAKPNFIKPVVEPFGKIADIPFLQVLLPKTRYTGKTVPI